MQNLEVNRLTQSLYGFNVEGFNFEARKIIERILKRYRPTVTLYSNDYEGANRLLQITENQTLIIHRTYQPSNIEAAWRNWSTNSWREFYKGRKPDNIYQTFLHNPIVSSEPVEIEEYITYVIDVLRWAMKDNYRLVFPLPDSSVSFENLVDKGLYDKLLLAYDDEGFREFGHIGGVREQVPFHLNLASALNRKRPSVDSLSVQTLLRYEFMQKSYWPTYEEVNASCWQSNEYLYRSTWITKRLEKLGRKPIPTVITEFNWGNIPSFDTWKDGNNMQHDIQKELRELYKITPDPYAKFSGIMSLRSLYENLFKGDPQNPEADHFEQNIFNQIEHIQTISPDNYLGLCWYTLDPGSILKDVRAGLSYQNILEKLEPKLYAMADKLNTAASNDQSKSSPINVQSVVDSHTIAPISPIAPIAPITPITPVTQLATPTTTIAPARKTDELKAAQIKLKLEDQKTRAVSVETEKPASDPNIKNDDWKVYWLSSTALRSNIRSKPDVKSDTIAKIEQEETLYYVCKQMAEIDSLGYHWIPISEYKNEIKRHPEIKGWVREDAINMRRYEFLYNLPITILVTVNNTSLEEVEWIKNKINSGEIKVEIKID